MPGEFAARKLGRDRRRFRWLDPSYMKAMRRKSGRAKDPLKGAPLGSGIVIEKVGREQKQPNSGIIKCVRVQLRKTNTTVTAHLPRDKAVSKVHEHDEVLVAGLGGSQAGPIGSMWGVKYQVIAVNGVSLEELRLGRKEKPKR